MMIVDLEKNGGRTNRVEMSLEEKSKFFKRYSTNKEKEIKLKELKEKIQEKEKEKERLKKVMEKIANAKERGKEIQKLQDSIELIDLESIYEIVLESSRCSFLKFAMIIVNFRIPIEFKTPQALIDKKKKSRSSCGYSSKDKELVEVEFDRIDAYFEKADHRAKLFNQIKKFNSVSFLAQGFDKHFKKDVEKLFKGYNDEGKNKLLNWMKAILGLGNVAFVVVEKRNKPTPSDGQVMQNLFGEPDVSEEEMGFGLFD